MKRFIALAVALVVLLSACAPLKNAGEKDKETVNRNTSDYLTGLWITFSELDAFLSSGDFKTAFLSAVDNAQSVSVTDIFVHVRPFCDSIYKSQLFPIRQDYGNAGFDVLEYIVSVCHERNIRVHAWINPYRVSTTTQDINEISDTSPAKNWLTDETPDNDGNVCISNGIYLNPASSEVRKLIIDGVREVVTEYNVDGIHFDDYFYPTSSADFDGVSYSKYCADTENEMCLSDWRRANVNSLISGCYAAVKFINKDITFTISPAASVERDYNEYFADVKAWCESGCVDMIIPQLYFGFDYPDKNYRFDRLLKDWKAVVNKTDTKLVIGLAAYKIGTDNEQDRKEWADAGLLKRQVECCKEDGAVCGHVYFSYSSLFSENELNRNALLKLKQ